MGGYNVGIKIPYDQKFSSPRVPAQKRTFVIQLTKPLWGPLCKREEKPRLRIWELSQCAGHLDLHSSKNGTAESHFCKPQKNAATACATRLQKRAENASGRTARIVKKLRKSVKKRRENGGHKRRGVPTPNFIIFLQFWESPGEAKSA